ncbi:MAG: nitroreductase family protein [Defluviitaleaceae bacterium]|nr:nitroreductase family protein [Defluviitaleaceae bacterium]
MTATQAIRERRSIRSYKVGAKVTDEQVRLLLEAAMLAPSACNTRPWEFIVIRSREKLDEIRKIHQYTGMLETADLAIVVAALPRTQFKAIDSGYFPQDCAAATQNILIEAVAQGLGACWCGVYPKEALIGPVTHLLDLEAGVVPFCIIAVGVPDETGGSRGFYEEGKVRFI